MKNLIKNKFSRKKNNPERPARITNETVAEHRERILAGGRKFKYPIQYARHKLVINTLLLTLGTLVLLSGLVWWQLYPAQNTSQFFYRLTKIVPLPVASVDGHNVPYSDYLMKYRSSIHYLQEQSTINLASDDGKRQADFIKRQTLDDVVRDAYAAKLATELDVEVTREEVDALIERERQSQQPPLSQEAYERVVLEGYYDWSLDEYRDVVRSKLLRREVSFALDQDAKARAEAALARTQKEDFSKVAKSASDDTATRGAGGTVGPVPLTNQDADGLIATASELEEEGVSNIIKGSDGYYIVKLDRKTASSISYSLIKIELRQFDKQFAEVEDTVKEYISIPEQQ